MATDAAAKQSRLELQRVLTGDEAGKTAHLSMVGSSSEELRKRSSTVVLVTLLAANVLLYASWLFLRQMPLNADSSEPFTLRTAIRNDDYLARFFNEISRREKTLFLGTSESVPRYNLGAQLNAINTDDWRLVVFAHGGLSPVHAVLAIARADRDRVPIPPLLLVINPVYFTRAYDIVDDGWMTYALRSPVFLQTNHRSIRNYLSEEVQQVYDDHFSMERLLYPALIQEYLGNLPYLWFHERREGSQETVRLPIPGFTYDGRIPSYDEEQNVWLDEEAVDQLMKGRWSVTEPEKSSNLKGLGSIIEVLKRQATPTLVIILPVNRKFYAHHGLDVDELDRQYANIRDRIAEFSRGKNIYLLDLSDRVRLRFGFRDRMHMDQYGFSQLASFIIHDETYLRFLEATNKHYKVP